MAKLIRTLEREGRIRPSGDLFNPSFRVGHIVLGGEQILKGTSQAERVFFYAWQVYHPLMWKAGYHNAPIYVLKARRELDRLRAELEEEATRLRR